MKLKMSLAVLAIFFSVAGTASHAESLTMNDVPDIEKTLRTFDSAFDLQPLDQYKSQRTQADPTDPVLARTSEGVEKIQAAIVSNKALLAKLEAKGVEIKNIVNAQQAADGSITFYLK